MKPHPILPSAVLFLVVLAAWPGFQPAAASTSRPIAETPISFSRRLTRVPVSIQGSAPFTVILDTGMPSRGVLLRASPWVDSLGLEYEEGGALAGAGDMSRTVASRVATASEISVGGLSIPEVPIIVMAGGLPLDVDGVIGAELFEKFVVQIDVDEQRLRLYEPADFESEPGSAVIPLRFREGSAFVDARVAVGSGEMMDADLAVDLGASHALWLNERSDSRFAPPERSIETVLGHGLSGPVRGRIGRVRRIELGNVAFDEVVTVFPVDEHQNPGGFDFRDGFVGADLLSRFTITFDYPGKRLILSGQRFSEPFEYDMTGLVLNPRGADSRLVDNVLAGSPAMEAGVVAGDALLAVDGVSIASLGPDGLMRAFRRDGAVIRLTLQRDAATREVNLKLRRLI